MEQKIKKIRHIIIMVKRYKGFWEEVFSKLTKV